MHYRPFVTTGVASGYIICAFGICVYVSVCVHIFKDNHYHTCACHANSRRILIFCGLYLMHYESYQCVLTSRSLGWPTERWRGQWPRRLNKPENGLYPAAADDDDGRCYNLWHLQDTCLSHPNRKLWAMKKCGVLKSSVFQPCHSEVPLEPYLER